MTPLTAREREVLLAVARHDSHQDAADELGISKQTIRNTLVNVHTKLGVKSTIRALWLVLEDAA